MPTWMGLISPYYSVFVRDRVFTLTRIPEIWRLVTPFILTGPKFGLLMDPYFLYTYGSQLETEAARFTQPGDFFMYLVFVAAIILVSPAIKTPSLTFSPSSPPPKHYYTNPRNICPSSFNISCERFLNRGRKPLVLCEARHSQNTREPSGVRARWDAELRKPSTLTFVVAMVVSGPYISFQSTVYIFATRPNECAWLVYTNTDSGHSFSAASTSKASSSSPL